MLVYEDIAQAHDFLVRAFGFGSGGIQRTPDGEVVHGEIRAGEYIIWLHRASSDDNLVPARELSAASSGLVVHVDDVDAHCERARANGAQISSMPKDQLYGQREYEARDPEGHRWWFATPIK